MRRPLHASLHRSLIGSGLVALVVAVSHVATAAPKNFSGSLRILLPGIDLLTLGNGTGTSDGGFGSPATLPGGEFPLQDTVSLSPPFALLITAVEIAAPSAPGVPGSNGPLSWDGSVGTMPLNASAFLWGLGTVLGAIPLNVVGVGGSQPFTFGFNGTVVGNPYRAQYTTVTGSTSQGGTLFLFASGFDNRTANGFGTLQLVSPTHVRLPGLSTTLPAAAILSLNFQPPPPGNDDFADATPVPGLPYGETTTLSGTSRETNEPFASCGFGSTAGTLWWSFTPAETQTVSVRVTSSSSSYTAVYTGASLAGLSQITCRNFSGSGSFVAEAGETYFIQVGSLFGSGAQLQFQIDVAPPPEAEFHLDTSSPSRFDTVAFHSTSDDPAGIGIETWLWDFGDGTTDTESGCCPGHRYAEDGEYTAVLTVTTFDGRSDTTSLLVSIETHDVAITRFSVPKSASAGQTRSISVGVNSRLYTEQVQVVLERSNPGGPFSDFVEVGRLTLTTPVRSRNRTTNFQFSYTFTQDDAAIGKVTFRATATILDAPDALPADNTAISAPTKVGK